MDQILAFVGQHPLPIASLLVTVVLLWRSICYIPNDRVGVVERLWSFEGSLTERIIALDGKAGFLPEVRRGGLHFFMPFQYRVHVVPLVTIPQGRLGYVFARDGRPLEPTQTLASNAEADCFTDVRAFLERGGQKGPQRRVLREGAYAVNLAQFIVITESITYRLKVAPTERRMFESTAELIRERDGFKPVILTDDSIGVITVHDGPSLPPGELVAPIVGDGHVHNNFQDAEKFLAVGGLRGRQLQVLVEGTYAINRLFATVERMAKSVVDVGWVGVVVSYTGAAGDDRSGDGYKHGELVSKGCRGVWDEALKPGKYAFNTYAGKIEAVPTTNFVLRWDAEDSGAHRFDENLEEITLITKDAFEPLLPLSVVVHIDYRKAPLVIQRFGDVKRLVEQTLDPMVTAYFKNVAQTRTLIQLIHDRSNIQQVACEEMRDKFAQYNLELLEVLIGTPCSPQGDTHIEDILGQLRARQLAFEQLETYARQQEAAVKERELREAEARAVRQHEITASELAIVIQSNQGRAQREKSEHRAEEIKILAEARAARLRAMAQARGDRIRLVGHARADAVERVGAAEAKAIEWAVGAYGDPRLQMTRDVLQRFSAAIEKSKVDVVPRVMVGGAETPRGHAMVEGMMAMLMSERGAETNGKAH
jgi:uncharacterized membrane protein YqiK